MIDERAIAVEFFSRLRVAAHPLEDFVRNAVGADVLLTRLQAVG